MDRKRIAENVLFIVEVSSFILSGYSLGLREYMFSFVFAITGLITAFLVGRMIHNRGKNAIRGFEQKEDLRM